MRNYYDEIQALKTKAEKSRQTGNREECLKLKKQVEQLEHEQIQEQHKTRVEAVKKDFPIGTNIPYFGQVTSIEEGCGTKSGWIKICFGDKGFFPAEIRQKLAKIQYEDAVNKKFNALKFSDTKPILIGTYDETIDELLTYMNLDRTWTLGQWYENNIDSFSDTYSYVLEQAKNDGYSDEQAEEQAQEAEDKERTEAYDNYKNKVLKTVEYLFNYIGIELIKKGNEYYILSKNWKEAANKMAEIITGYGIFEYKNGKELKEGLPAKTFCEAVIKHLHWLRRAPEIYGDKNYDYMMR